MKDTLCTFSMFISIVLNSTNISENYLKKSDHWSLCHTIVLLIWTLWSGFLNTDERVSRKPPHLYAYLINNSLINVLQLGKKHGFGCFDKIRAKQISVRVANFSD